MRTPDGRPALHRMGVAMRGRERMPLFISPSSASHPPLDLLRLRGGTLGGVTDPSSVLVGKAAAAVASNFLAICVLGGYLARIFRQRRAHSQVEQLRTTGYQRAAGSCSIQGGNAVSAEHQPTGGDLVAAPSMTVMVPCYMPNEQAIIQETIDHIMNAVEYPATAAFELLVCYNTPEPLSFEAELHAWIEARRGAWEAQGRSIRLMKVEGSTSKAENLNAALQTVGSELTAIFDADHHPNPDALLRSTSRLLDDGADCVQGSIYLRRQPDVWAKLVHAEFFVTHFVYFPAMAFGARTGFFAGSNAVWRSAMLRRRPFRVGMQTEDIDMSMRVLLEEPNARISFCPESRSGELPCATLGALWRQRLRWATGWDEVTLDHAGRIWRAPLSLAKRLGMYYMLPLRWLALASVILSQAALLAGLHGKRILVPLAKPMIRAGALCSLVAGLNAVAFEQPSTWVFIGLFLVLSPVYAAFNLALVVSSLVRIATGTVDGWAVTTRAGASPPASPQALPPAEEGAAVQADAAASYGDALPQRSPGVVNGASAPTAPASSLPPRGEAGASTVHSPPSGQQGSQQQQPPPPLLQQQQQQHAWRPIGEQRPSSHRAAPSTSATASA